MRLPGFSWCYQPLAAPEVNSLPALETGHATFGSLNNPAKITPTVIALWSRILNAVPTARLVLLGSSTGQPLSWMQRLFEQNGVRDRVTWFGRSNRTSYLRQLQRLDLALDPFPYNGSVTSCDTLWMGVPLITLAGSTYGSRQGVCLLSNLGLPELITTTPDAYGASAVTLAGNLPRLAELRAGLRERMRRSPVTDVARFTRHLEEAFGRMWAAR